MWSDFDSLWTSLVTYLFQPFLKGAYSWLLITQILANPNESWFPLDFLHTGTVILPEVTQTSCNWKKFLFPFRSFLHNCTLYNSNHVLSTWQAKKNSVLKPETLNSFQNNHVHSLSLVCHPSSNSVSIPVY